jgi:activator of HSP90 ATPase
MSDSIHQEIDFPTDPLRVYSALTDSAQFSELTNAPADIGGAEGASFSCFGGMITGRHVELVTGERLVQAWRVANWEPGVYSIVKFELKAEGNGTKLIFDQSGFPPQERDHLDSGWGKMYWDQIRKYLSTLR